MTDKKRQYTLDEMQDLINSSEQTGFSYVEDDEWEIVAGPDGGVYFLFEGERWIRFYSTLEILRISLHDRRYGISFHEEDIIEDLDEFARHPRDFMVDFWCNEIGREIAELEKVIAESVEYPRGGILHRYLSDLNVRACTDFRIYGGLVALVGEFFRERHPGSWQVTSVQGKPALTIIVDAGGYCYPGRNLTRRLNEIYSDIGVEGRVRSLKQVYVPMEIAYRYTR